MLARHFAKYPGSLNIRRGDTPVALYDARVAHAVQQVKEAGVKTDRLTVSDGMPSERVVTILSESANKDSTRGRTTVSGRITQ